MMTDQKIFVGREDIIVDGYILPGCDVFLEIRDTKVYPIWETKRRFFFFKKRVKNLRMTRTYFVKILVHSVRPDLIAIIPYKCESFKLGSFLCYGDSYNVTENTTTLRSYGSYIVKELIKRSDSDEWEELEVYKQFERGKDNVKYKNTNV